MPEIKISTIQVTVARYNPVANDYEFLVLRRSPDDELYPGIRQIVTGTILPGEKAFETAKRETAEETGVEIAEWSMIPSVGAFFNPYDDSANLVPSFGAMAIEGAEPVLSPEHDEAEFLPLKAAIEALDLPAHKTAVETFYNYSLKGRLGPHLIIDTNRV